MEETLHPGKKTGHPAARVSAPRVIAGSFALMILCGALLLMLPCASRSGQSVGFLNALFTATSANCVTGLVVVNTQAHWTLFGQLVILLLIQLGGLGLMTIVTISMVLLQRRVTLQSRLIIQSSFNQDSTAGMVRLVKRITIITLLAEATGAVLLCIEFAYEGMPLGEAAYKGVFHAVSAFCNAGFDILGPDNLVPYRFNALVNAVVMLLIVIGGLGFTVWTDFGGVMKEWEGQSLWHRLRHCSLHSKMAACMTGALILLGTLLFLLLEWDNPATLGRMTAAQKGVAALFQSVTLRTAGFNTIPQDGLTDASQFVSVIWMMIGGSPAGTAGGMKTVTLGVLLFAMLSAFRGKDRMEAFGRTIPMDILQKALTVCSAMLGLLVLTTLVLHFSERGGEYPHTFLDLLFESASAVGTVGLTTGLTPHLSAVGRVAIILCMYMGRIGPVTAVIALNRRLRAQMADIRFPEERVIIG